MYATVFAYSDFYAYDLGEDFDGTISTYCAMTNESMMLDWVLHDDDNNQSIDSGSFNWTAQQTSEQHNVTSTSLATAAEGNYSFTVEFSWYNTTSMAWEVLDSDTDGFFVMNMSSGGGNHSSGPSCSVYAWSDYYWFYVGDNFTGEVDSYCSLTNETLMIEWAILNTDTNMTVDAGNVTWTTTMFSETQNVSSTALANQNAGNYSFEAMLSWYNTSSMAWELLDSDGDPFSIYGGSTGGGGNHSGNQTDIDGAVMASTTESNYASGDTVSWFIESSELVMGEDYHLEWAVVEVMTNTTVATGNASWTAYTNMSGEQGNLSGLSDGMYCLDASLYQHVDTSAYWVDYDYACFNVGNSSSGNHSDAFMDIDFDYEITQVDDDTIGLSYTVNNSGNWSGNFYYQAYLLPGDLLINEVYGNVSINGMGVYSDSTTFDIMGLTDGAEVCVEMMFVDTNGNTEAEGEECITISIDSGSNNGNETGNNTGGNTTMDSDGDGVLDADDLCPNTPAGTSVDTDGCPEVVDVDSDGDGVFDQDDLCPNTTAGVVVDEDGCEVITTPTDSDGDGVIDADDLCPNTPAGTSVDATGCEVVDPVDNNTGNASDNGTTNTNVAPTITNVSITPLLPETGDTLTCAFTASDENGDTLAGTYVWTVNETIVAETTNTLSDGFAVGDTITCTVIVSDGTETADGTATTVILPEGTNDVVDELEESGLLPSVGTIGTLLAIALGVGLTRRQDD